MESVNLFFSCDDNYVPFLSVALTSIRHHSDPNRRYCIRILHTGLDQYHIQKLESGFSAHNIELLFCDITEKVASYTRQFHTRDYFSQSTYYRLFIPEMFPELNKGLYLDSDLILMEDVAKLYDTDMGANLVGAVPDGAVAAIGAFQDYVRNRLQVEPARYFNAGVLLMNLEAMRQFCFQQKFLQMLNAVTFKVAQDQDYLNVICRDRVTYLDARWNTMPSGVKCNAPMLIHYNLDSKPWHRDDVEYQEYFWNFANQSSYCPVIRQVRSSYTAAETAKSQQETVNLIALATQQAMDEEQNGLIHEKIRKVMEYA